MDTQNRNIVPNKVAEIVLSYQPKAKLSQVPEITSSKEAYEVLLGNWDKSKLRIVLQLASKVFSKCLL